MLKFNKATKKKMKMYQRLEVMTIKLRVVVTLFFLKNVQIKKDTIEYVIISELSMWAKKTGIKFDIKEEMNPIYVKSHHILHQLNATRHCKILIFSK